MPYHKYHKFWTLPWWNKTMDHLIERLFRVCHISSSSSSSISIKWFCHDFFLLLHIIIHSSTKPALSSSWKTLLIQKAELIYYVNKSCHVFFLFLWYTVCPLKLNQCYISTYYSGQVFHLFTNCTLCQLETKYTPLGSREDRNHQQRFMKSITMIYVKNISGAIVFYFIF